MSTNSSPASETASGTNTELGLLPNPPNKPKYHGAAAIYHRQIERIEDTDGVYEEQLVPQLMGFGLALRSQGQFENAISQIERALHLTRVNSGLHSLNQVPILMDLIKSYKNAAHWDRADDKLAYLLSLLKMHHGNRDPRLLPAMLEFIDLRMGASERDMTADSAMGLIDAYNTLKLAIRIMEQSFGPNDPRLTDLLYSLAVTQYRLELYRNETTDYLGPGLRADGPEHFYFNHINEPITARIKTYAGGVRALTRRMEIIDQDQKSSLLSKIDARIAIGDWRYLFNRRHEAVEHYVQLQAEFQENEEARKYLEEIFSKPRAISFDRATYSLKESPTTGYIEATFKVTASGRAQNIEILETSPPEATGQDLKQAIKTSRFRPRIVDGKPVATEGVNYKHIFALKTAS